MIRVISLARYAICYGHGEAIDDVTANERSHTTHDHVRHELAMLCEEQRIKDARMARIPAAHRPHYLPVERMAILELNA